MFITQLIIGALMISASVVFHVATLMFIINLLKKNLSRITLLQRTPRIILLMVFNVLIVIGVHTVEAWSWAALYLYLGEFSDLQHALYFSVVTATTLGYGDVTLAPQWHLLSTFEAMGGLILFGVSTAFLLELMRHLLKEDDG
jgi:voltage-gated potassium channel